MKTKIISLMAAALLAPALLAAPAAASEMNMEGWQFRLRGLGVFPEDNSSTSIGGNVEPSNVVVPEFDITYFWTKNWATELILATTPHDVKAYNTGLGDLDLGQVWLLPPTLTMQYHFMPDKKFQPYVGAGVNYTVFYHEKAGPSITAIKYDDSFGVAAQVGFDYQIDKNWFFNADLKKLWLSTDVSINGGAVTSRVHLDPWLAGLGVGYRF